MVFSRFVDCFSQTISIFGLSIVKVPRSDWFCASDSNECDDEIFGAVRIVRPSASLSSTSFNTTPDNQPSEVEPTVSVPLSFDVALVMTPLRMPVFAAIAGANHANPMSSIAKITKRRTQRRGWRGFDSGFNSAICVCSAETVAFDCENHNRNADSPGSRIASVRCRRSCHAQIASTDVKIHRMTMQSDTQERSGAKICLDDDITRRIRRQ